MKGSTSELKRSNLSTASSPPARRRGGNAVNMSKGDVPREGVLLMVAFLSSELGLGSFGVFDPGKYSSLCNVCINLFISESSSPLALLVALPLSAKSWVEGALLGTLGSMSIDFLRISELMDAVSSPVPAKGGRSGLPVPISSGNSSSEYQDSPRCSLRLRLFPAPRLGFWLVDPR